MSKKQQPKLKIIKKDNKFQLLTEDNQVLNKPGVKTTDLGFPNLDPMTITDFNNYNTPGRYAINLDGFNSHRKKIWEA